MISCRKHQFNLPADLHYLNCAYMAPLSAAVEEAGLRGLRKKRNPAEINPHDFFADCDRARRLFGRLVHADPASIALIPSVSYGISTIARNLKIRRGQTIVLAAEQFPSNVYAWQRVADHNEAVIVRVGPGGVIRSDGTIPRVAQSHGDPTIGGETGTGTGTETGAGTGAGTGGAAGASGGRAARWNERLLEAIDHSTAVVAVANVHWADGTLFDLDEVGARAREVGAVLVVDGTQSVGALPFDVGEVRPDALICAGYKWLMGPYSMGVAYFAEGHQSGVPLEENWIARRHSENFSALVDYEEEYQPGSIRYDVGERSNFILVPMLCAAIEHVLEWTPEAIQEYCSNLTGDLIDEARELGYAIEDGAGRGKHLFGIRLPSHVTTEHLREELKERNVAVSVRGNAVRVSPHVYNDQEDVSALRDVLVRAAGRSR